MHSLFQEHVLEPETFAVTTMAILLAVLLGGAPPWGCQQVAALGNPRHSMNGKSIHICIQVLSTYAASRGHARVRSLGPGPRTSRTDRLRVRHS